MKRLGMPTIGCDGLVRGIRFDIGIGLYERYRPSAIPKLKFRGVLKIHLG